MRQTHLFIAILILSSLVLVGAGCKTGQKGGENSQSADGQPAEESGVDIAKISAELPSSLVQTMKEYCSLVFSKNPEGLKKQFKNVDDCVWQTIKKSTPPIIREECVKYNHISPTDEPGLKECVQMKYSNSEGALRWLIDELKK